MPNEEIFSISSDFTSASDVDLQALSVAIDSDAGVFVDVDHVDRDGDWVHIHFQSPLDGAQRTALTTLVGSYTYVPIPAGGVSTSFEAVVSQDDKHPGDYSSVAAAFAAGAQAVFVKRAAAPYVETSDIVIPNGGQLVGELPGQTAIYLAAGASVRIDGSGGVKETAGTISVTSGSATVTGTGTSLDNLSAGNFVLLGTNYFEILTVDSATQVTLKETYHGTTLTNVTYVGQPMFTGCKIANLIVTGSSSVGVYVRGLRHGNLKSIAITKCAPCLQIVDCGDLSINEVIPTFSTGVGVTLSDCVSVSNHTINVFGATSHGFEISGPHTTNIVFESCTAENNGGIGFNVLNSAKVVNLNDCVVKHNNSTGIFGAATTEYVDVSNTEVKGNNGDGVDFEGANCTCSDSSFAENSGAAIAVAADCIVEGNHVTGSAGAGGIGISLPSGADGCTVSDNRVLSCGGTGIDLAADGCTVCGNSVSSSTGHNVQISGSNCAVSGNVVQSGSAKGVFLTASAATNCLTGNRVTSSAGTGLELDTGATDNLVCSNLLLGNTGSDFVDNGTTTTKANNSYV